MSLHLCLPHTEDHSQMTSIGRRGSPRKYRGDGTERPRNHQIQRIKVHDLDDELSKVVTDCLPQAMRYSEQRSNWGYFIQLWWCLLMLLTTGSIVYTFVPSTLMRRFRRVRQSWPSAWKLSWNHKSLKEEIQWPSYRFRDNSKEPGTSIECLEM